MKTSLGWMAGVSAWLLGAMSLYAAATSPRLAPVFTDHMVLQQGMPLPVWGTAKKGAEISVEFAGQRKNTVADPEGKWMLKLDSLTASAEPKDLTVSETGTAEKLVLHDVLVGEVWICAGGTTMQTSATGILTWANPRIARFKSAFHKKVEKQIQGEIAAATDKRIRLLVLGQPILFRDHPEMKSWQVCSPESMPYASYIGYCFSRELANQNVPVGFITATAAGSRIESWVSAAAFESSDLFKGKPVTDGKKGSPPVESSYRACIQPLIPLAARGVLWYQGEQDIWVGASPLSYCNKLELMVQSWRKAWGREDLPFYCGQLSTARVYGGRNSDSDMGAELLPAYQDAQRRISNLPHTGLVVTADLTEDTASMCPVNKWEIARRFWLWAANDCYGKKGIVPSGPLFKGLEVRDGKAVLKFDHCGGGLVGCDNKPLRYFQVCGPNGAYYPAQATIEGDTVVVSNPEVKQPAAVRYAWHAIAPLSLYNKDGLPASAFCSETHVSEHPGTMASTLPDAGIVRSPIPDKTVVLTFDDACLSQLTFAAPIMKKYGFGGTFFVCEFPTRPTEKRDELYLTWPQIKQLNDMGFEIGNHSMNHPLSLASLPHEQIVQEIASLEEMCVKHGIPKPVSFAYPNYSSSQEVVDIVRQRGYLWARSGGSLYDPKTASPLMVPCVILPRNAPEKVREYIDQAKDGKALVLLFHGVPDKAHPWVTYAPADFEACMKILKESGCKVVALRDLSAYVNSTRGMDFFQPIWR